MYCLVFIISANLKIHNFKPVLSVVKEFKPYITAAAVQFINDMLIKHTTFVCNDSNFDLSKFPLAVYFMILLFSLLMLLKLSWTILSFLFKKSLFIFHIFYFEVETIFK